MKVTLPHYLGKEYVKQYLISILMFLLCYMVSNYVNSLRDSHYHLYFAWELKIPFTPWMMLFYGSLYILPVYLPNIFKTKTELFTLLSSINWTLLFSAVIFIFIPTTLGVTRQIPDSFPWNHVFMWLHSADHPYNLFPSYHVILATLIFFPWINRSSGAFKYFLLIWMILIDISILFVHQHHTPDLISGFLIGTLTYFFYFRKKLKG